MDKTWNGAWYSVVEAEGELLTQIALPNTEMLDRIAAVVENSGVVILISMLGNRDGSDRGQIDVTVPGWDRYPPMTNRQHRRVAGQSLGKKKVFRGENHRTAGPEFISGTKECGCSFSGGYKPPVKPRQAVVYPE